MIGSLIRDVKFSVLWESTISVLRGKLFAAPDFIRELIKGEWGSESTMALINAVIILLAVIFASWVSACVATDEIKRKGVRKRHRRILTVIPVIYASALICFFGCTERTIQGVIMMVTMTAAGYKDIRTHTGEYYISVILLAASFIGIDLQTDLPQMMFAGVAAAGVMTAACFMFRGEGLGGIDLQVGTAMAFMLGFNRGMVGLIGGMLIAVISESIIRMVQRRQNNESGFPLLPYFAISFGLAFFML